ncbi:autophagy-related protein 2 [Rhodococcus sp. G-MC3]|uniref:autophagy-related protein 2 n=1 Tax=Rhodococcus sp. G-MC3 TaxID=3046209 RepID=UPI0024B8ED70|nr:autophagy-related protein 2 [Rhodococcus sp. G-MC3]MDJ0394724.1 autophagy-related protein 2 [Rhodococcus sp. G-MC3]
MTDTDKPVDTTIDPTEKSKGMGADTHQSAGERGEAQREFDDHMDGSGDDQALPTPDPEDVTDTPTDPKTTSRTE